MSYCWNRICRGDQFITIIHTHTYTHYHQCYIILKVLETKPRPLGTGARRNNGSI